MLSARNFVETEPFQSIVVAIAKYSKAIFRIIHPNHCRSRSMSLPGRIQVHGRAIEANAKRRFRQNQTNARICSTIRLHLCIICLSFSNCSVRQGPGRVGSNARKGHEMVILRYLCVVRTKGLKELRLGTDRRNGMIGWPGLDS